MSGLSDALDGWAPEPVETVDAVDARSVAAFSGMLDLPEPAAADGGPVPPLWHWFAFLDRPAQAELGEDGHPARGHFLPPVPDRRRMFAGGRLRSTAPLHVGVPTRRRSTVTDIRVKAGRSGEMAFVTVRHEFRDADDGRELLVEEQDIVYRSQPPGSVRGIPAPQPEPPPEHAWRFTAAAGPPTLFRFSALTYNSHRIHYDREYATGVEGYPGLVVQGPFLALLALEIPRRHRPDAQVSAFEFRLTAPAFDGADVWAAGSPAAGSPAAGSPAAGSDDGNGGAGGETLDVAAGSSAGGESVRGRVTLR